MDEAIDQLRADYDTSPYESSAEADVRDAARRTRRCARGPFD
jgi:hypothetical protein